MLDLQADPRHPRGGARPPGVEEGEGERVQVLLLRWLFLLFCLWFWCLLVPCLLGPCAYIVKLLSKGGSP